MPPKSLREAAGFVTDMHLKQKQGEGNVILALALMEDVKTVLHVIVVIPTCSNDSQAHPATVAEEIF